MSVMATGGTRRSIRTVKTGRATRQTNHGDEGVTGVRAAAAFFGSEMVFCVIVSRAIAPAK
jgi:hypothetical protein